MSTHSTISAESRKPPEVLEQEIDSQRNHIDALIDEVELRLTPQRLLDQALAYGRDSGGLEIAERLGHTLKANPIPVALTAIGLAWLAVEQVRGREPEVAAPAADADDSETLAEALEQARHALHEGSATARETLQQLSARAEYLASSVKQGAGRVDAALRERPWAFAAAGLALGALVGVIRGTRSGVDKEKHPEPPGTPLASDTYEPIDKPPFRPGAL